MSKKPSTQISHATRQGRISEPARHQLRQMAMEQFYASPLDDGKSRALNESPDWDTIRPLIEPHLRTRIDHEIGLWTNEIIAGEYNEYSTRLYYTNALHSAIGQQWSALWNELQGLKPDTPSSSEIDETIEGIVHTLCYPPFTIPVNAALSMYDRALQAAIKTPYEGGTFKDSPLMHDTALIDIMESALREVSDGQLQSCQRIGRSLAPADIVRGVKYRTTFAQERDYHHAKSNAMSKIRKLPGDCTPPEPDLYDLFAELETRIGTDAAAKLGAALYERFTESMDRSLERFKKAHHLDEPFHYQGKVPELG